MRRTLFVLVLALAHCLKVDANIFTVTSTKDSGAGSLREAIDFANSTTGRHSIHFNIPGAAPHRILPLFHFPWIESDNLIIDGTTQPANGYVGPPPYIIIDGDSLAGLTNPLLMVRQVDSVQFYGLYITNAPEEAIGCICDDLIVGAPGKGNVISGNRFHGIYLYASSKNALVRSNIFGLEPDTVTVNGNGWDGVHFWQSSTLGFVGGANKEDFNIFSNNRYGVNVRSGEKNMVLGNTFYCNNLGGIGHGSGTGNNAQVSPMLDTAGRFFIKGKARPGELIQIYGEDSCQNCEGKYYYGDTVADAQGNWIFFADFKNSRRLVATATDAVNNTSMFSKCIFVDFSDKRYGPTYVYVIPKEKFKITFSRETSELIIETHEKAATIMIHSLEGKKVKEARLLHFNKIDFSDLPKGVYMYSLDSQHGGQSGKIITF